MKITLKTFASIRDIIGFNQLELDIPDDATAGSVIETLAEKHEGLASHRETLLIAVNSTYCGSDTTLKEGDTMALFPPVSGG